MEKLFDRVRLENLDTVARDILDFCGSESVFALDGAMGAGKTTLAKALCAALGCKDVVSSPTFAIVNVYYSDKAGEVYHFDFYRINSLAEAEEIGTQEYLYSGSYCFMEWSERVEALLPESVARIQIDVLSQNERQIKVCV